MAENVSTIGYTRVSKADGRQVHDLQCDALIAAGVEPERIYQDISQVPAIADRG